MSRSGNPYDNAVMESFNATDKRECVGLAEARGGYAARAEARQDFFDYVEKYYNRLRRHSALGYKTPVDFENQLNLKHPMRIPPQGAHQTGLGPVTAIESICRTAGDNWWRWDRKPAWTNWCRRRR